MSWEDILKKVSERERAEAEEFAPKEMKEATKLKRMKDGTFPTFLELKNMFEKRRMPDDVKRIMLNKLLKIFQKGFDEANSPEEWNESYDELSLHIKTVLNNIFDSPYEDADKWLAERNIEKFRFW